MAASTSLARVPADRESSLTVTLLPAPDLAIRRPHFE
jgi:hypothetical protein